MTRLLEWTFKNRLTVIFLFAVGSVIGLYAVSVTPVDAVPDITPVQVVVNTKTGALDPEQIEKTVSFPIETDMSGIAHVKDVRSLSKYGLSQVVVVFEDRTDIYWARQQVAERLQGAQGEIPAGLAPKLAPISTGLGEVVMYSVVAKPGTPLAAKPAIERLLYLRTIQDFVVVPYLRRTIKNVAEVDTTGGYKKEIHIELHPERLEKHGVTIEQIAERLKGLGENSGGGYIQPKGRQLIVRTSGRLKNLNEILAISIKLDVRGKPVPLSAVADVKEGYAQRMGGATSGGEEAVLGTVLMLSGANSRQVALDSEQALKDAPLPPDVQIDLLYTRSYLVNATLKTVMKSMAEGAVLVVVVLLAILGNMRGALFVSLEIPISMLFGAIGMKWFGVSASLMSLGAIDFGLLVDGAVVMIENSLRRLEEHKGELGASERLALFLDSAVEVVKPVTLGLLIIMLVYVPILSLEGIEGKLFHPMALTVLMALGASLLVAVFLMPVLAYLFLKVPAGHGGGHDEGILYGGMLKLYEPILAFCLKRPLAALAPAVILFVAAMAVGSRMGADFMPPLDEGDLVVNFTRPSDIGVDASLRMQEKSEKIIAKFPEVERVFGRLGTAESATDAMGVHLADTFLVLQKDLSKWPLVNGRRRTKNELFEAMKEAIEKEVPGQEISENQPIEMRFAEILEGSRADVSLRVYGKDLPVLIELLEKSIEVLEKVPGTREAEMDALTALRKSPVLSARPNYAAIARYGLDIQRVNDLLEAAMAGREVGSFYEQQWRFPIVMRVEEEHRENVDTIKSLPVGMDGGSIPLNKVVDFETKDEVTTIAHHYSQRYAAVAVFLGERDIASYVAEARAAVEREIKLPEGYTMTWGGQFKNLERAKARLALIVPAVLLAILLILWRSFGSLREAVLIYTCIPLAMTGGVFSLAVRGIPLSVSASVGFIALMGIAILNGMVLVTFFNQLREKGRSPEQAAKEGSLTRLRPVAMTALVAGLGFVPMALNTGIGAEVQRPLATVVIGGLLTSTLLTLIVLPVLYKWVGAGREKKAVEI
ncbi:MAG: CusA/CzcA family heavy metal efflux RND transporter [Elusimicrobiota bacterium]|nr:CusA/CzcA family heavy metal efflux RND transporter [Elusimicrobiota bacterium]